MLIQDLLDLIQEIQTFKNLSIAIDKNPSVKDAARKEPEFSPVKSVAE